MAQYLFAGMTLKHNHDPSLTDAQRMMVREWRQVLYEVARQEMGHLGTVQNLLSAVGGAPYFAIPRFPTDAVYYEAREFTLQPLTLDTAQRFVAFEAPLEPSVETLGVAPDPLEYQTVGDLYTQILEGLESLGEARAFIGAHSDQDRRRWSSSVEVHSVLSMEEARQAIRDIVIEGEGTPSGGADSHYHAFQRIEREYVAELAHSPDFRPYRPVAPNPQVLAPGRGTKLTNPSARDVASLFGSIYTTTLLALAQYYKFQEKEGVPLPGYNPQDFLRSTLIPGLMKSVVRPLGQNILPELAVAVGEDLLAGPTFEHFMIPDVPWNRSVVWHVLTERLRAEAEFARERNEVHAGLERIADNLARLAENVNELKG